MQNWRGYWNSEAGPREVLRLALPLVLSTCSLTLQVFIDRLFLTWYSAEAIAAAIPVVCVLWVLLGPLHGIVSFANTFVAQYHGAGRSERVGPVVGQALLVGFWGGAAMLLLIPFSRPLFHWIGHDPAVRELETVYLQVLLTSAAPMLVMTAASSFFGGLGRAWVVFFINVAASLVNVVLDYALIFGRWGMPELGIAGAAWATTIAYAVAAALSLVLLWLADEHGRYGIRAGALNRSGGHEPHVNESGQEPHGDGSVDADEAAAPRAFWSLDLELTRRLLRFGGPAGLMMLIEVLGWTWFVLLVGRLGTAALAATNVAFNINTMAFMPMFGFSTATQILTGQRLGENRPDLAARSTWSAFWLAFVYTVILAAGYLLLPELFLAPFRWNTAPDEYERWHGLVVGLLRFVALYTLFDMSAMVFAGALRGAGDTRFVMTATLGLAVVVLAVPSYVVMELGAGNLYTAWGFVTAYVMSLGIVFFLRFRSGVWRSMRVIEPAAAALPPPESEELLAPHAEPAETVR